MYAYAHTPPNPSTPLLLPRSPRQQLGCAYKVVAHRAQEAVRLGSRGHIREEAVGCSSGKHAEVHSHRCQANLVRADVCVQAAAAKPWAKFRRCLVHTLQACASSSAPVTTAYGESRSHCSRPARQPCTPASLLTRNARGKLGGGCGIHPQHVQQAAVSQAHVHGGGEG